MKKISLHKSERRIILIYCSASILLSLFFLELSQAGLTLPAVAAPTHNTPPQIWVDVAGKVKNPGLYSLSTEARVNDAINAAGGVLSGVDLTSLNLAAHVVDGEEIIIGVKTNATPYSLIFPTPGSGTNSGTNLTPGVQNPSTSQVSPKVSTTKTAQANTLTSTKKVAPTVPFSKSSSSSRNRKTAPTSAININLATVDQLEQLPSIGPVMAEKIVAFRSKYGKFKRISDIQNVAGMGEVHFAKIKNYIKVG